MKYARIVSNTAVDVRMKSPDGCFHPEISAQFVAVPDQVEDGWTLIDGVWAAPVIVVPVEPAPVAVIPPKVSPVEFKMLFTAQERIAIRAARASDPVIDDFFDILEDPRLTEVNLALASNQQGLGYLESLGLLSHGRAAEILTGVIR